MARVAIEVTAGLIPSGGISRSVREMAAALLANRTHDFSLFAAGNAPLPPELAALSPPTARAPFSPITMTRLWHRLRVPLRVELFTGKIDLFFATDFGLPPTLRQTRSAVFIHDLTYIRVPDAAVPSLVRYLNSVVPRSLRRADVVIVNSHATRLDLIDIYNAAPEKIAPVQFGVRPHFAPSSMMREAMCTKFGMSGAPYVLAVGTVQPRKNYARLIEAVGRLRARGIDLAVVIVGGKGWLEDPIYAAVDQAGMRDAVTFLGFVDDGDLPALYTHCACFAMPSLYEGFGLPILEAMSCGAPVVTSNVSSLPEAAGDAALLVEPTDPEALSDAIERVVADKALRESLVARGRLHAAGFTWARTAEQIVAAFSRALG